MRCLQVRAAPSTAYRLSALKRSSHLGMLYCSWWGSWPCAGMVLSHLPIEGPRGGIECAGLGAARLPFDLSGHRVIDAVDRSVNRVG